MPCPYRFHSHLFDPLSSPSSTCLQRDLVTGNGIQFDAFNRRFCALVRTHLHDRNLRAVLCAPLAERILVLLHIMCLLHDTIQFQCTRTCEQEREYIEGEEDLPRCLRCSLFGPCGKRMSLVRTAQEQEATKQRLIADIVVQFHLLG